MTVDQISHPENPFIDMAAGTAFFVIALAIVLVVFLALRERSRRRLMIAFLEKGQEIPPALLPRADSRQRELRRGTWLTGLAIGVALTLYVIGGDWKLAAWGLVPLCLGAASFVNAALFHSDDDSRQ
jgi:hypothetical protein